MAKNAVKTNHDVSGVKSEQHTLETRSAKMAVFLITLPGHPFWLAWLFRISRDLHGGAQFIYTRKRTAPIIDVQPLLLLLQIKIGRRCLPFLELNTVRSTRKQHYMHPKQLMFACSVISYRLGRPRNRAFAYISTQSSISFF